MLNLEKSTDSEKAYPYYSKAPITEAVLDLRVSRDEAVSIEELQKFRETLKTDYPNNNEEMWEVTQSLQFSEPGKHPETTVEPLLKGYKLKNSDGRKTIISTINGMGYSQLEPYETWEPFCAEAQKCWAIYKEHITPSKITRLAVRFINRIDMPPGEEFGKYIRTYPEVSSDLPQELSNFLMQIELPQKDIGCMAHITQTVMPPPPNKQCISILLDIDLFRNEELEVDENEIWSFFKVLRRRKDEIFEACITDLVREEIR